ncbi:MAG: hypothetical protein Q4A97_09805 [Comamonadaceae bacterium]|nr:hypothetical protein [Comamonadaceae bacterium]
MDPFETIFMDPFSPALRRAFFCPADLHENPRLQLGLFVSSSQPEPMHMQRINAGLQHSAHDGA